MGEWIMTCVRDTVACYYMFPSGLVYALNGTLSAGARSRAQSVPEAGSSHSSFQVTHCALWATACTSIAPVVSSALVLDSLVLFTASAFS